MAVIAALAVALFAVMGTSSAAGEYVIKFSDTDGVVSDGTTVDIMSVTEDGVPVTSVAWVRISGELTGTEGETAGNDDSGDVTIPYTIIIPAGTTHGEYTVSVGLGVTAELKTGSAVLTVGDPGTNVAAASLSLARTIERANLDADNTDTDVDESDWEIVKRHATATEIAHTSAETPLAPENTNIFMSVAVLNSLGKPANHLGVTGISISAPGATITQMGRGSGFASDETVADVVVGSAGTNTLSINTITANSVNFVVKKASAGTVGVTATVVGADGLARSETITLTFTGPADAVNLGDASDTLLNHYRDHDDDGSEAADTDTDGRDNITLAFTATDKAGNPVAPSADPVVTIKDPEGLLVQSNKLVVSATPVGATNHIGVRVAVGVAASSPLKSGTYSIQASQGALKAESVFVVVSTAATISVEVDDMAPSMLGQTVTATATVLDAEGEDVADGTMVDFQASGSNAGVAVAVRTGAKGDVATKGGQATATFVIATSGASIITAVADGKSAAAVVLSTAGADDSAMPEEEASVSCLSNLAGFATWACGVESSASEIFGLVSGRGATALHLWNGSAWVRYSVVDGTMVPGSSDFMVAENDILYISN